MKKLTFIAAFTIIAVVTCGQPFQKGNTFGLHVSTIIPDPDVTMNQYLIFCKNKLIPAYEESYPGVKCYLARGIKGEYADTYSFIMFWKSRADMEKYFKQDGSQTDLGKVSFEKMKSVREENRRLAKTIDKYTDWEIQ